jgi:RNA recognition motif-containing protein
MNIYVANISFKATESELKALFENYGAVDSVKIIKDRETQKSRGFGFVEMPVESEGESAISALNGFAFAGRELAVNEAKPQEARSDNRKPYSGGGNQYGSKDKYGNGNKRY